MENVLSLRWKNFSTPLLPYSLSLSPPASQSFLKASFYLVYSSFWSLIPLSPRQAGFLPRRGTLDQILYLSQSISDEFNKSKHGSRTILANIDFSKAFRKLISVGLPPYFTRCTQSFLFEWRLIGFLKSQKSLLSNPSWCSARIHSWPCTFLSFYQGSLCFSAFFRQLLSLC